MKSRCKFNDLFGHNRKFLYLILCLVIVSVLTLTIAYAALNTMLKIDGNAEVVASEWNIFLDNVELMNGSSTSNVPIISDKNTLSFSTTLVNPGDYYMFTVDVVNNGSIDAMINSIEKLPELSSSQAKYLNYIVEYQSGESINTKQLVSANSFVRLKVKVEFREDILSSDLPTQSETLDLSFKVNYVQADDIGTSNVSNSGKVVKVVSGDYDTVGSEICIKDECFYVISSDDDSVTMLSKYNLYVSGKYDKENDILVLYGDEATGIQNETIRGWISYGSNSSAGVLAFSKTDYWFGNITEYPSYIYNEQSNLYPYVENYKKYLQGLGTNILNARLISYEEIIDLGCNAETRSCTSAPIWVYYTSYWTGSTLHSNSVLDIFNQGNFGNNSYSFNEDYGVRPVIEILKSEF